MYVGVGKGTNIMPCVGFYLCTSVQRVCVCVSAWCACMVCVLVHVWVEGYQWYHFTQSLYLDLISFKVTKARQDTGSWHYSSHHKCCKILVVVYISPQGRFISDTCNSQSSIPAEAILHIDNSNGIRTRLTYVGSRTYCIFPSTL